MLPRGQAWSRGSKTVGLAIVGGLCFGTWVLRISLYRSWKSISAEGNRMHKSMEA